MRKPAVLAGLLALNCLSVVLWLELDEVIARVCGSPVRLLSSSDPLEIPPEPNPFTHVFLRDGNLRVVVRAWFYDAEELGRPYLAVDEQHNGVLHVPVKPHVQLIQKKCEYLRQFEVELLSDQWRPLKSLRIEGDDTHSSLSDELPISNPRYLQQLLQESQQQVASEKLPASGGC